jgi:hypothetical protein
LLLQARLAGFLEAPYPPTILKGYRTMFYTCTYLDHSGAAQTVKLDIRQCHTGTDEIAFYAWGPLGCGKNAPTPEGACRILVNDHGRGFISAKEIPPVPAYTVTVTRLFPDGTHSCTALEFPNARLAAQAGLLAAKMAHPNPAGLKLTDFLTGRRCSMAGWSAGDRSAHVEVRRELICK